MGMLLRGLVIGIPIAEIARGAVSIPNSGFETPSLGSGVFQYAPTGASWTFSGSSGLAGNGAGFTSANANAPQGSQVAFSQGTSRISQTISGFQSSVKYMLRFSAAQRNYNQPGQTWNVELDGVAIASFAPPQVDASYFDYAVTFAPSAGSHEIAFRGTLLHGGDCTVLIDNVRILEAALTPAAPDGLGAILSAADAVTLSWNDNSNDETNFAIEEKTAGGDYVEIARTGASINSFSPRLLAPGVTYSFRVRAINEAGPSNYSTEVVASIPIDATQKDYSGRPFVTQKAPALSFLRKVAPNLNGIDYTFPEQTARGVALLSRFPAFTNRDVRIHVMGPWYSNNAANLHFSRGVSTISALPRYRLNDSDPATVRKLAPSLKWDLEGDPLFWSYASSLADKIASTNASDARIAPLRTFATSHVFVDHRAAFTDLGKYVWESERLPLDINGRHVDFFSCDIEQTGGWEFQRDCFGWLYSGMATAAAARGRSLTPLLYGQYQFSINCFDDSTRQGGATTSNPPNYLLADRDFLAAADPTTEACRTNAGVLSMDGYVQAIWGNDPFLSRDTNGAPIVAGGAVGYSTSTNTFAYGARVPLEVGEAKHCLDNLYRQALRMHLQWYRRAGAYPANSALRKSFLANTRIGAWTRYTNEGLQGILANDRPLPPWEMELLIGMYLFTADDVIVWSSDMNYVPANLGANYSSAWKYNAHGVLENVVKAAHRYNACDPLHSSDFKWCWFILPVINQNLTPGDRYFEKPIAFGKLRQFEGHTYLELFVAWPALDNDSRAIKVWVDQAGVRSSAYTARLANGRSYFYDAWQLPDTFSGLEGKDINLRTTDLLGVQRTWRGDWRVLANNTIAAPSDFPRPSLSASLVEGVVSLSWDQPNFALESAAEVTGPWIDAESGNPWTTAPTNAAMFLRLRQ